MTTAILSSGTRRFIADFAESRVALASLVVLVVIIFVAAFAPLISPTNPYDLRQLSVLDNLLPPGSTGYSGQYFLLGSDAQGRDMLSAIFYGLRTSLVVGVSSGVIAMAIGVLVGLTAAYVGGSVGALIMRIVDLQLSFPTILVALILLAVLGQGGGKVILALVVVQWAYYTRIIRGAALVEGRQEYVEAARGLGLSHVRIVLSHILPNCLPPLIVVGTIQVAHAITLEATLSFLGVGLPPTEPSLGLLIANGFAYVMSGRYWISLFPGTALLITLVSINLVGDQLRDVLNPRLQR